MTTRISDATRARIAEAWPVILAGLVAGELARQVLKAAGVDRQALHAWMAEDPARRAAWDNAREDSAESFYEEALEVARGVGYVATDEKGEPVFDKAGKPLIIRPDSAHARTLVDTLKWAARIRNPRAYSDKAILDVNVKTVDLTRIISEANARLAAGRAPRILEHTGAALDALPGPVLSSSAAKLLELL